MDLFGRNELDLRTEDVYRRQAPLPESRITEMTGTLNKRQDSAAVSGSQTSAGSSLTPIVIGVVVPVLIIAIILFVVWRRRQKITKLEESHDKYRSLDFGVDPAVKQETKRRKADKRGPEMAVNDLKGTLRKDRGLSLDLGANPYLLPPEVQQSRESLHSLSRTINNGDDKYRATNFIPDDGSIRSPSSLRSVHDGSSIFTGSTKRFEHDSRTDFQPRGPLRDTSEPPNSRRPLQGLGLEKPQGGFLAPMLQEQDRNSTLSTGSGVAAIRASNNYLAQYISGGDKKHDSQQQSKQEDQPGLIVTTAEVNVTPPMEEPRQPPSAVVRDAPSKRASSFYGDHAVAELADTHSARQSAEPTLPTLPKLPTTEVSPTPEPDTPSQSKYPQRHQSHHAPELYNPHVQTIDIASDPAPTAHMQTTEPREDDAASDYYEDEVYEEYENYVDYTYRGSMLGVRPLPPDDPAENPEQRANRIRSFYKEYFEDGSGGSGKAGPPATYYDGSEQYEEDLYGYYEHPPPPMRPDGRYRAMSQPRSYRGGPRAFSSMSGRSGPVGPRPRMAPKKNLPPPKPLMLLPTPGKLKEDDFLPNAIDFAPPQVFKNQRAGTPDSLRGGLRPYSPSIRAHVPLTSSFDDLAVMPSP